jgi:Short C-terminal domain
MNEEKIIKKEDKLQCNIGFFGKRGTLVLTSKELYFLAGKSRAFSSSVNDIVSVNAKKGLGNGIDHLFITFTENGKEQKIKITHQAFWQGAAMGNLSQLREPYFKSWEAAIESARFGRNESHSDLDDLEKLADLKSKGVITEEEFQAKKKQLLGL